MKNDLLCTPDKRILWLSDTYEGHVHDKKIIDEQPLSFPTGITLWQDTGFLGHCPSKRYSKNADKETKRKRIV